MSTKSEYVAKMKLQLDSWIAEIDALEAQANKVREHAKVKYAEQLAALHVKREEGEKKLKEMRLASDSAWEHVRAASEKAWAAFKDSVQALQAH